MVDMLLNLIILLFFFTALIFLFRACLGLIKQGLDQTITLRSLTNRLIVCILLIMFLLAMYKLGYIEPHPFGIL